MAGAAGFGLFASALPARAQTRRVGILLPSGGADTDSLVDTFRAALAVHAGATQVALTVRSVGPEFDADAAAKALMDNGIEVAVGASLPEVQALMRTRSGKPIVMVAVGDPVGAGLAASLEQPGGDVTGLSDIRADYPSRRLQLVRDMVPGTRRIGFLHNPDAPTARLTFDAARGMAIELVPLVARAPGQLQSVLADLSASAMEALLVVPNPLTFRARGEIAARAAALRMPLFFGYAEFMDVPGDGGAIASYGTDLRELYGRAADYVWRLLDGARPQSMAIGRPNRGQLIINVAVARRLGIVVSKSLLRQADRVVG